MATFTLTLHPASEGDALILTWGKAPALRHALVDLGRGGDYKPLKPLLQGLGEVELFALSHIDADHIEGAVSLFKAPDLPFKAREVWFNARAQLLAANARLAPEQRVPLGSKQAEKVSEGLAASGWPLNSRFASRVVSVDSPEGAAPLTFAGGLQLTLLSPTDQSLANLLPVWLKELMRAGLRLEDLVAPPPPPADGHVHLGGLDVEALAAKDFKPDQTKPNGSSIAFIAQYNGARVLMAADAYSDIVEASLRRLGASETQRYRLACLKVAHHGSQGNTSPGLLGIIDCTCFAFSTDGSRHGHPDPQLIARILKADPQRPKTLVFNFRQPQTLCWNVPALMQKWNYRCVFPAVGQEGRVALDLLA